MNSLVRILLITALSLSMAACGDADGGDDLGSTHADATPGDRGVDAGPRPDAADGADIGAPSDLGADQDAESRQDAEPGADLGPGADAEPAADAETDGGVEEDGGEQDAEAGTDAEPAADADADASVDASDADVGADADAGPDAAPDAAIDAGPGDDGGVGPSICNTPPSTAMSFFVTEAGNLSGDFGGLAGADARCAQMAAAAGITGRNWVAYLSTLADATYGRVDAADRIGNGPWYNHAGNIIGTNASIHGPSGIPAAEILTECGRLVEFDANDFGGDPGAHDVFTGSTPQGTLQYIFADPAFGPGTCADWTSSLSTDRAYVGHSDWNAGDSWNAAHITAGCDEAGLRSTAANGRIYCFATN